MENIVKGILLNKEFTPSGTVLKFVGVDTSFNTYVPSSYLLIGSEVFYTFNPKLDRGERVGIAVTGVNNAPVIEQVCRWNGITPSLMGRVKEVYDTVRYANDFEGFLRDEVSPKTLKSMKRTLYGFNFILSGIKNFLQFGMTYDAAEEIFEIFGFKCFKAFETDPYNCVGERLKFEVADAFFYDKVGILGLEERYNKIVDYLLKSIESDGSTLITPKSLAAALHRARISRGELGRVVNSLTKRASSESRFDTSLLPILALKERLKSEKELAGLIHSQTPKRLVPSEKIEEFKSLIISEGIKLTKGQENALSAALFRGRTCCLTGGPGTGKTTCLKTIIRLMRWAVPNLTIKTAAPTGKAAKRLSESSGEQATTIHKLLEPRPSKEGFSFARNERRNIEADVVIIDESSMMGTNLAVSLYKALKPDTMLLLVGDVDQLPSVEAGQVFHDLIVSGKIPVYRLTKTMRQADGSLLLKNIHAFRDRRVGWECGDDFRVFEANNPQNAFEIAIEGAIDEYKNRGLFDFQVLVPQHHALCGTEHLNRTIQRKLNPYFKENNEKFFMNDKVILLKNNARRDFLNGDVGRIVKKTEEGASVLLVDGRTIFVPVDEYEAMDLAYAVTVHKAQGSEYYSCMIICMYESIDMLSQNWVYTAISRAKNICEIIAEKDIFKKVGIGAARETYLAKLL